MMMPTCCQEGAGEVGTRSMSGQPGTQQQDTITEEDMQAFLDEEDRQAAERREDKDDQAEHQQVGCVQVHPHPELR
jgi:hypothetical protein